MVFLRVSGRARDAAALLLIAACITIAFWKIALTSQYTFIESPDIGHQVLPWLQVQASALRRGVIPLWDPYLAGGQPLAGQVQPAMFSPFTWLLLATPLNAAGHLQLGWIHAWFVFLHILAGWFAYAFLRSLAASRWGSVAGGVFFGAAGFVGNTPWPQIAAGAIWLPLVFLFYLRSLRGERPMRNAVLAGGFLALSFLAGHHAVPVFACLAIAGVAIAKWRFALPGAFVTLAVGILGAAVQILPAIQYAHYAVRWVNAANPVAWGMPVPYPVHEMLSWKASELLFLVLPGSTETIVNPLVGVVPLTLALLAVRRRGASLLAGVALAAILFSLARANVFHGVLYAVIPGLEKARAPIMAMALADVAIAALAAMGLDALMDHASKRGAIALTVLAAFLFIVSVYPPPALQHAADRAGAIAIVAALLALVLWQSDKLGRTGLACAVIALALFEIGNSTGQTYVHQESKDSIVRPRLYGGTADLTAFLRGHLGASRFTYEYNDLLFNIGDWEGIDSLAGFVPSAPTEFWQLGAWNASTLDLYAVRYYVARQPLPEEGREVFQSAAGIKVWERPSAMPRAWIEGCGASPAVAVRFPDENHAELTADLPCEGTVVLADNWFPGWRATVDAVDATPAAIQRVHTALRAVNVPRGHHVIRMAYEPGDVYWGAGISFAVMLGLLAVVLVGGRRGSDRG